MLLLFELEGVHKLKIEIREGIFSAFRVLSKPKLLVKFKNLGIKKNSLFR